MLRIWITKKELLLEERLINITMLKNMEMVVLFSNLGNCQCQRAFHLELWMDRAVSNFKRGDVSSAIDLSDFSKE